MGMPSDIDMGEYSAATKSKEAQKPIEADPPAGAIGKEETKKEEK